MEKRAAAARFAADWGPGAYPDWYGGAYIDPSGALIVNLVEAHDSADKTLALQIQDWAGGPVGFGSVKYSLSYLRRLQEQAFDAMYGLGLSVGCSVDEEAGRVVLTLSSVTDEALALLAELDPEDDAILVLAGPFAQDGSGVIQPGGEEDPLLLIHQQLLLEGERKRFCLCECNLIHRWSGRQRHGRLLLGGVLRDRSFDFDVFGRQIGSRVLRICRRLAGAQKKQHACSDQKLFCFHNQSPYFKNSNYYVE